MSDITATDILETTETESPVTGIDQSAGNFKYDIKYDFDAGTGLSERTIDYISSVKKEASWLREFRHAPAETLTESQ